jgi:hypothetical protein
MFRPEQELLPGVMMAMFISNIPDHGESNLDKSERNLEAGEQYLEKDQWCLAVRGYILA